MAREDWQGLIFISLNVEPETREAAIAALDALREELEAKGVPVKGGLVGYRLPVIDDLDGNELFFNYPNETASGKVARENHHNSHLPEGAKAAGRLRLQFHVFERSVIETPATANESNSMAKRSLFEYTRSQNENSKHISRGFALWSHEGTTPRPFV